MFEQLRFRLILVNLLVIGGLFLLLTGSAYYGVKQLILQETRHVLSQIGRDIVSGDINDIAPGPLPPPPHHRPLSDKTTPEDGGTQPPPKPGLFFLLAPPSKDDPSTFPVVFFTVVDADQQISRTSTSLSIPQDRLPQLLQDALAVANSGKMLSFNNKDYFFVMIPNKETGETLFVFEDAQHNQRILRNLILGLSAAGFITLIISLFASIFMANRAMVPIKQAWQQQQDFVADASHELRTPLSIIQTNLEVIRDNSTETVAAQTRWLDNIQGATFTMANLVQSLLLLAQADLRQQAAQRHKFSLDDAVFSTVDFFRPELDRHNLHLNTGLREPIPFWGDQDKFRQLVGILLDNAIRHTAPDGYISVNLEQTPKEIVLSVADTGEGIASAHQNKIFDRFYQTDPSRSSSGAGLGLAIAKAIVDSHGGTITVDSVPGDGSTFIIRLPKS